MNISNGVVGVIVFDDAFFKVRFVTGKADIAEPYVSDAASRASVVFIGEYWLQVEEAARYHVFYTYVVEMHIFNDVLVACVYLEYSVAVGREHVAVLYTYIFKYFAFLCPVVAMAAKVERAGKVAEYGSTTNLIVFAASPIPPAVIVECEGIIVVAEENILNGDIAATHHVDTIAPRVT